MRFIYAMIFLGQLYSFSLYSQATIAPEVGINSQHQYHIEVNTLADTTKAPAIFLGLIGTIPISNSLHIDIRINYVFRRSTTSSGAYITSAKVDYTNRELNSNVDILYVLRSSFKLGGGIGVVHKLNSSYSVDSQFINTSYAVSPKFLLTGNLMMQYEIKRIGVSARYFYVVTDTTEGRPYSNITTGKSGFSLGISYKLFGKQL